MVGLASERSAGGFGVTIPGADRLVWYILRVSGLLLVLLAGGHILITHYLNVPSATTFGFVASRWANPLWRTFDWLLLMAALWHGVLGLRYSVADYLRRPGWRVVGHATIWVLGFIFTAIGTISLLTFDEAASRDNTGPLAGALWIADLIGFSLYAFAIVTYLAIVALAIWIIRSVAAGTAPIYAGDPGQYAWVFHRASGIGILFFLLVHIIDIMLIGLGRDVYDASVAFYSRLALVPMELLLVGAVVYHILNGLRIIVIDFSRLGYRRERQLFWGVLGLTVLLVIPAAIVILRAEL
jgi:succinate dehydrogenase cytochrome b556 subunit